MRLLRSRVRMMLGLTFLLCWIAVGAILAFYSAQSESSVWDAKLQVFGFKLLLAMPADKLDEGPFNQRLELPPPARADTDRTNSHHEADNFNFQVWSNSGKLFVRTPDAPAVPFQPNMADGFSSNVVAGRKWRIYSISDRAGKATVQVANLQSVVDHEMRHEALFELGMLTGLLALVAVLTQRAINNSLKPIGLIEAAIRRRKKFDLTPLPSGSLPTELEPLVDSFNHVLVQLKDAVEVERSFIDDAAHELRTPLSALQAQAQVALRATTLAEKDAALHKLLAVIQRSTRLSEQLLDLSEVMEELPEARIRSTQAWQLFCTAAMALSLVATN